MYASLWHFQSFSLYMGLVRHILTTSLNVDLPVFAVRLKLEPNYRVLVIYLLSVGHIQSLWRYVRSIHHNHFTGIVPELPSDLELFFTKLWPQPDGCPNNQFLQGQDGVKNFGSCKLKPVRHKSYKLLQKFHSI